MDVVSDGVSPDFFTEVILILLEYIQTKYPQLQFCCEQIIKKKDSVGVYE